MRSNIWWQGEEGLFPALSQSERLMIDVRCGQWESMKYEQGYLLTATYAPKPQLKSLGDHKLILPCGVVIQGLDIESDFRLGVCVKKALSTFLDCLADTKRGERLSDLRLNEAYRIFN